MAKSSGSAASARRTLSTSFRKFRRRPCYANACAEKGNSMQQHDTGMAHEHKDFLDIFAFVPSQQVLNEKGQLRFTNSKDRKRSKRAQFMTNATASLNHVPAKSTLKTAISCENAESRRETLSKHKKGVCFSSPLVDRAISDSQTESSRSSCSTESFVEETREAPKSFGLLETTLKSKVSATYRSQKRRSLSAQKKSPVVETICMLPNGSGTDVDQLSGFMEQDTSCNCSPTLGALVGPTKKTKKRSSEISTVEPVVEEGPNQVKRLREEFDRIEGTKLFLENANKYAPELQVSSQSDYILVKIESSLENVPRKDSASKDRPSEDSMFDFDAERSSPMFDGFSPEEIGGVDFDVIGRNSFLFSKASQADVNLILRGKEPIEDSVWFDQLFSSASSLICSEAAAVNDALLALKNTQAGSVKRDAEPETAIVCDQIPTNHDAADTNSGFGEGTQPFDVSDSSSSSLRNRSVIAEKPAEEHSQNADLNTADLTKSSTFAVKIPSVPRENTKREPVTAIDLDDTLPLPDGALLSSPRSVAGGGGISFEQRSFCSEISEFNVDEFFFHERKEENTGEVNAESDHDEGSALEATFVYEQLDGNCETAQHDAANANRLPLRDEAVQFSLPEEKADSRELVQSSSNKPARTIYCVDSFDLFSVEDGSQQNVERCSIENVRPEQVAELVDSETISEAIKRFTLALAFCSKVMEIKRANLPQNKPVAVSTPMMSSASDCGLEDEELDLDDDELDVIPPSVTKEPELAATNESSTPARVPKCRISLSSVLEKTEPASTEVDVKTNTNFSGESLTSPKAASCPENVQTMKLRLSNTRNSSANGPFAIETTTVDEFETKTPSGRPVCNGSHYGSSSSTFAATDPKTCERTPKRKTPKQRGTSPLKSPSSCGSNNLKSAVDPVAKRPRGRPRKRLNVSSVNTSVSDTGVIDVPGAGDTNVLDCLSVPESNDLKHSEHGNCTGRSSESHMCPLPDSYAINQLNHQDAVLVQPVAADVNIAKLPLSAKIDSQLDDGTQDQIAETLALNLLMGNIPDSMKKKKAAESESTEQRTPPKLERKSNANKCNGVEKICSSTQSSGVYVASNASSQIWAGDISDSDLLQIRIPFSSSNEIPKSLEAAAKTELDENKAQLNNSHCNDATSQELLDVSITLISPTDVELMQVSTQAVVTKVAETAITDEELSALPMINIASQASLLITKKESPKKKVSEKPDHAVTSASTSSDGKQQAMLGKSSVLAQRRGLVETPTNTVVRGLRSTAVAAKCSPYLCANSPRILAGCEPRQSSAKLSLTKLLVTEKNAASEVCNVNSQLDHVDARSSSVVTPTNTTPALVRRKCVICCSGLTRQETKEVRAFCGHGNFTFENKFTPDVTHLIMKTVARSEVENANGTEDALANCAPDAQLCERTMKYFLAMASGKWILRLDWVRDSLKANRVVNEAEYMVDGDVITGYQDMQLRVSRMHNFGNVLKGWRLFCNNEDVNPTFNPPELKELMSLAGAEILDGPDKCPNDHCLLISSAEFRSVDDFDVFYKSTGAPPVSVEWVYCCITGNSVLPIEDYLLCYRDLHNDMQRFIFGHKR